MRFLGIDGGGTKTAALLVESDGEVLGRGNGRRLKLPQRGMEAAFPNVRLAVEPRSRGARPTRRASRWPGQTCRKPRLSRAQRQTGHAEPGQYCNYILKNDVIAALRAGSRFPYGVAVVCGTGFNAGGIGRGWARVSASSDGPLTGDQPGARRLATRAIGAAFRTWDGRGEPTLLADIVLKHLGAPNFETLAEQLGDGTLNDAHIKSVALLVFKRLMLATCGPTIYLRAGLRAGIGGNGNPAQARSYRARCRCRSGW